MRRSYGGTFTKGMKRLRHTVHLRKGEALVLGSGLRHRGCMYTKRNVRLFLAFVVGRSDGASFEATYNVQDFSRGARKKHGGKNEVGVELEVRCLGGHVRSGISAILMSDTGTGTL